MRVDGIWWLFDSCMYSLLQTKKADVFAPMKSSQALVELNDYYLYLSSRHLRPCLDLHRSVR